MESFTGMRSRFRASELALALFVCGVLAAGALLSPAHEALVPEDDAVVLSRVPVRSAVDARQRAGTESATVQTRSGESGGAAQIVNNRALVGKGAAQSGSGGIISGTAEHDARTIEVARADVEAARRDGDPRHLGHAEALLAPLLATSSGSTRTAARVLYATILQSRHDFAGALRELDALLESSPADAQAQLTRATVLFVLGRHAEAERSCEQLAAPHSVQVACRAPILAVSGREQRALAELEQALRSADEATRPWLLSIQGELLYWYADSKTGAAQRALGAALLAEPEDRYTRALYADVLLDLGRSEQAQALIRAQDEDESLKLRAMLASSGERRSLLAQQLRDRFAAARLRGDNVHQREEARLLLALGEPERALALALEGFAAQRELWDVRLVLETALAARRPAAAREALTWLRDTHCAAPRLLALVDALERGRALERGEP